MGISFCSFLNVLIYRLPKGLTPLKSLRSFCPVCKFYLKWWHNIPILSFFILKGKCYYCKFKISFRYPLVELLAGVIFLVIAYLLV
ncbi:hypothetical protein DRN73_10305 [Candidatus Pacearchaeota archaeon]|nr:MAG: hypothetical protein DRN73_10305 [Candidatus Pacearchaeota archaeon]